jgi:hypothetical protein
MKQLAALPYKTKTKIPDRKTCTGTQHAAAEKKEKYFERNLLCSNKLDGMGGGGVIKLL